ncbi:MAG: PDZ domain-containing protein [Verrucomicrobia bacterium]|nr:PDZ domain-containing protein [Verrucomicrobiota bacterium]
MRRIRSITASLAVAALPALGFAAEGTNAPAPATAPSAPPAGPAADAAALVRGAVERLAQHGVLTKSARLEEELLSAVVMGADPGGCLMSEERFKELELERQGMVRGIGIRLAASNGQTYVAEVFDGGPAAGKLQPGDTIDRLADRYATGFPVDTLASWLRGATGEVPVVVVRAGEKKPIPVSLAPSYVRQPALAIDERLPGGAQRIEIRGFWPGAADALARAWHAAATNGGPGVILDLRSAGGGDASEAAAAARLACAPSASVFALENLADGRRTEFRGGTEPPLKGPLMLLVGPHTTGAAEAFAAALKAGGQGALLVGGATAGDPLIREALPFDTERRMYVTTRRLLVAGAPAELPVRPHVEVASGSGTRATARAAESPETIAMNPRRKALAEEAVDEALRRRIEGDAVLERAVDILHALHALGPEPHHVSPGPAR